MSTHLPFTLPAYFWTSAWVVSLTRITSPRTRPFVPGVQPPEPFTLVIFGATGDLAARKLLPALHGLWGGGFLPRDFVVVGVGRRDKDDHRFREDVRAAVTTFRGESTAAADGP